tara:strand:+ start:1858 stop:2013 length:156 start_codon:yes stop_codon:yes gene_type:complete
MTTLDSAIEKVADKITDDWGEMIRDYMESYDVPTTDDNIGKVIDQIVYIYR